jgi:glutathione S-transferase
MSMDSSIAAEYQNYVGLSPNRQAERPNESRIILEWLQVAGRRAQPENGRRMHFRGHEISRTQPQRTLRAAEDRNLLLGSALLAKARLVPRKNVGLAFYHQTLTKL